MPTQCFGMSFSNNFAGKIVSELTSGVIVHGVELSKIVIFISPYDSQKP